MEGWSGSRTEPGEDATEPAFDSLADIYDLLTDWEKRLPAEVAFLDGALRRHGARSVLDAGCGTGAHLVELAKLGYAVSGADVSSEMVERARRRCGPGVEIAVSDFAGLPAGLGRHDAVMSIGNSLPNAGSEEGVRRALGGLVRALTPGGVLLLHLLNYPALLRSGGGRRPPRTVEAAGRTYVFEKEFTVLPERVVLEVVARSDLEERRTRSELWPVALPWLSRELGALGLEVTRASGGFDDRPYDAEESPDLVVLARGSR